jgi:segregation and condensation protein B
MNDTEVPARKRSRSSPAGSKDADRETEQASTGDLVAQLGGAANDEAAAPGKPPRRARRRAGDEPAREVDPDAADTEAQVQEQLAGVTLSDELPIAAEDDLTDIEGEASLRLVSIVESLLFAANKALGVREIRQLLKEASLRQVQLALKQLGRDLQGRGILLAQVAGGFRLRTDPENSRWVQLLLAERPARLSRSQLETLAVIAYRQPVTKPEVDHIRGVDCAAVMKILLDHDLVRIVGRKEEPGRPHLYGTTVKFLEFFNLRSLRDMPDLHEFRELTEESRQLVAERLGDGALFDERESMGQEVLDWGGRDPEAGDAQHHDERADDDAQDHHDAAQHAQEADQHEAGGQPHHEQTDRADHGEADRARPNDGQADHGGQADDGQADDGGQASDGGQAGDGQADDGEQADDDDDEADEAEPR